MLGVERWCFTICALFMLYTKRSYVTASNKNKIVVSKSFNEDSKSFTRTWPAKLLRQKGSSTRLEESEPGFDFNDEEIQKLKIWPNGAIPYYVDGFSFDKVFQDRIRAFLHMTNTMTGLNFLELHRPPDDDVTRWVFFVNRQGLLNCADHAFKNFTTQGVQKILLGYDCLDEELAEVVLELVGVPPQHNAPNRNKYIEVIKENIMAGKAYLFDILKDNEWLFHGIDYDFSSAGHYSLHKYSVNGKVTIKPLVNLNQLSNIGNKKMFSYMDIWKIRMIYNYISKKRSLSLSKPDCNKLFNVGSNFSNYVHESEDEIQPRKKPNKYLGLPDEPTESLNNNLDIQNDTKINPSNTQKGINNEESIEENKDENKEVEHEDLKSDNPKEKLKPHSASGSEEASAKNIKELNEKVNDNNPVASHMDNSEYYEDNATELKFVKPG